MIEAPRDTEPRPRYYRIPQTKGPDGERQFGKPVPVYEEDLRRTQILEQSIGESRLSSQAPEVILFKA